MPFLRSMTGLVFLAVFAGCGIAPRPGATRLAPTPIGMVLGTGGGGTLPSACPIEPEGLKEDIPVFIVSSRIVEEGKLRRNVDPFGNTRSRDAAPNLAIARVAVGERLSEEQIFRDTVSGKERKKTRLRLAKVSLFEPFRDFSPWEIESCRNQENIEHPWVKEVRAQLDRGTTRHIVIFVHGYNTHLIRNTEQTAELFHYMGRDGAVVNFEWPSQGRLAGYLQDKGNAEQSTRLFRALAMNLAHATDACRVSIIAHSAGTPIVVNALREMRLTDDELEPAQLQAKFRIDRVVLAAPDMDLMAFFNAVYDRFHEVADGIAVYASPDDKALALSGKLFNNERLGRSIDKLTEWEQDVLAGVDRIEMIDVSEAERTHGGGLGHGYFHRNPWVSWDIGMFMSGNSPRQRGLVRDGDSIFWRFPPDYPERQRYVE